MSIKPWFQERNGRWELNPGDAKELVVNVGTANVIVVDKLYGPLAAGPVRVRLEYTNTISDWVVEYRNPTTRQWEEKARWDCQENWPEDSEP